MGTMLNSESLPDIDIRKLSQSELHALSRNSDFAFDLHRTDDIVSPNIDRTNFNESAGSRRQTYSLRRESSAHHHRQRTRIISDSEDSSILHFLKHYVNHNSTSIVPPPPPRSAVAGERQRQLALAVHVAGKKRKRARKNPQIGVQLQRVNKEVDFETLESNGDELYRAELQKWTAGLRTEAELLEFLSGLEGQWGSTRKRRKYVDASRFGDALPAGWTLLLGLKRHHGSVSVYCRSVVSPTGEQFVSCKEAATFLRSYFQAKGSRGPRNNQICLVEQTSAAVSKSGKDLVAHADNTVNELGSGLTPSFLADIDNLPEVQILDLFECYKCNLTLENKNAYLQHLMSFHQQTTRRFKFGGSVTDGLIAREKTFECQFCHKVFQEKRDYNAHVAVHSRNETGTSEAKLAPDGIPKIRESPDFPLKSNVAVSSTGPDSTASSVSRPAIMISEGTLDKVKPIETYIKGLHGNKCILADGETVESVDTLDKVKSGGISNKYLIRHGNECTLANGKTRESEDAMDKVNLDGTCNGNLNQHETSDGKRMNVDGQETSETDQIEACLPTGLSDSKEYKEEKGFGCRSSEPSLDAANILAPNKGNLLPTKNVSSPVSLAQPFEHLSPVSNKGGSNEFCSEDSELDEMEYDLVDGNKGPDLACDTQESMSLVGSDTKDAQVNMKTTKEFTTVCVWCRSEFKMKAFKPEMQLDSIGYMCAKCKDNISGHFNRICS